MEWRKLTIMLGTAVLLIGLFTLMSKIRKDAAKTEAISGENAREVFLNNCGSCHGKDGAGTTQAKGLRGKALDPEYVRRTIQSGNTVMPGFHFTHDSIVTNLINYVHDMK